MNDAQKPAKSTAAKNKSYEGFTDEERGAMKDRAQELKTAGRRGSRAGKADGESDVLEKIAEMREPDRALAERLPTVIKATAPALAPRPWYGMPAYAKDGKIVCFFQPARLLRGNPQAPASGPKPAEPEAPTYARGIPLTSPANEDIPYITVTQWVCQEGARVESGELVVKVETDMGVRWELEAPVSGVLRQILVHKEDDAGPGIPLAIIEPDGW